MERLRDSGDSTTADSDLDKRNFKHASKMEINHFGEKKKLNDRLTIRYFTVMNEIKVTVFKAAVCHFCQTKLKR